MAKFIEQITVVGVGQIGAIVVANINLGADVTGTLPVGSLSSDDVTVTAGTNLTGGGTVALGSSITINCPNFVASGSSHAAGAVPDPGASGGTTHFLREDATWAVPPSGSGTVTSVNGARGTRTDSGSAETTTATLWGDQPVNLVTLPTYTISDGDRGSLTILDNGIGVTTTLPQAGHAGAFPAGWFADYYARGSSATTITPVTSVFLTPSGSSSSLTLIDGAGCRITSDGTNYYVTNLGPVPTAADTSIVIAGTIVNPTFATNTLDVIATNHPPAANWSNNSKKITSLANGSASSDAAAYGQTPAGGATVTIGQGGTNSTAALGNGCVMVSVGGAIVESGTLKTGGGSGLTGLGTPTGSTDAAPKSYVDGVAQGLSVKQSCQCATTAPLPTYTYLSGVITMTATGTLTIDGHLTALGDRVLVNKEATINQPYQGIYTVTTAGAVGTAAVMARAADSNTAADIETAFTFIEFGSVNAATGWVNTNTGTIVVGTTAITYAQFSGAGEYTADGTTLALTGNQFSIVSTYTGQTSITTLGTVGTGTWTGTTIAILHGGTGVTSVTTSPTASVWAGWDANKNLSANNFLPAITEYNSPSGTTTLTVSSTFIQYFYGTLSSAILKMPVASTLVVGQSWMVINEGAGNVTVSSSGSNTIAVLAPDQSALITCITASGTTSTSWYVAWIGTIGDDVTTEVGGGIVSVISGVYDAYGTSATETTRAEAAEALLAPLASPALTGTPTLNGVDISVPIPTNYAINGGLQFQQPLTFNGSSTAYGGPATSDLLTFDRWKGNSQHGAATVTVSQQTPGPNSPYYAKFSDVSSVLGLLQYQIIESYESLAMVLSGATVTAQVQAKMPTGAQKLTVAVIGWSGTADTLNQGIVNSWATGASTDPTFQSNFTVIAKTTTGSALTSSFQQVSVTTTLSKSSGYNNLLVAVWFDVGTAAAFELDLAEAGLFISPGPVPWVPSDVSTEYDRVRRFSELFGGISSGDCFAPGYIASATVVGCQIPYYPKRKIPSLSFSTASTFTIQYGGGSGACTAITTGSFLGVNMASVNATVGGGGLTLNAAARLQSNSSSAMIWANAEL